MERKCIESDIKVLRDPFILAENGVYYAYGSKWLCYKNTSGDLAGNWEFLGEVAEEPKDFVKQKWAPEVYNIDGKYYMVTTYFSEKNQRRGCAVFVSDSPTGKFKLHSDGQITPENWDCIDGTLYFDENGQPYMIFVHEWITMPDKVGTMAVAKMSKDLKTLTETPVEIFRADAPKWACMGVTDGCWIYKTHKNTLLMTWSNFDSEGYCVAVAESKNGNIYGPWEVKEDRIYSKTHGYTYDGGHAMTFKDFDGNLWLSMHSPNNPEGDREEKPVFYPLEEIDGNLKIVK